MVYSNYPTPFSTPCPFRNLLPPRPDRPIDPAEPAEQQLQAPRHHSIKRHTPGVEGHANDATFAPLDCAHNLLGHILGLEQGTEEVRVEWQGGAVREERRVELAGLDEEGLDA